MSQVLVGGLTAGAIYALLALGLVTVFRVAKFLNLAQGEFYVWGALLATTFVAAGWPLGLAVVAAILITKDFQGLNWKLSYSKDNHVGPKKGNYVVMKYDAATGTWSLAES